MVKGAPPVVRVALPPGCPDFPLWRSAPASRHAVCSIGMRWVHDLAVHRSDNVPNSKPRCSIKSMKAIELKSEDGSSRMLPSSRAQGKSSSDGGQVDYVTITPLDHPFRFQRPLLSLWSVSCVLSPTPPVALPPTTGFHPSNAHDHAYPRFVQGPRRIRNRNRRCTRTNEHRCHPHVPLGSNHPQLNCGRSSGLGSCTRPTSFGAGSGA